MRRSLRRSRRAIQYDQVAGKGSALRAPSSGPLAAAALIVTMPVALLSVIAQRQIAARLTAGAIKGG
jgi:ABC-type glycerol-3-phosphate transport system permease component